MPKFLSDEWFEKVEALTTSATNLEIPKSMKDVTINLTLKTSEGDILMRHEAGLMKRGHAEGADVQMTMPDDYAYKLLVLGDWSVGMKGYVARKISVSGNMRKLIPLQVFKPTKSQNELRERIKESTEFTA